MTVYIGADFHPHQQTVCWCDPETGEIQSKNLSHNSAEPKQFYQAMPPAIIGIEASTNAPWYEALLHETGARITRRESGVDSRQSDFAAQVRQTRCGTHL